MSVADHLGSLQFESLKLQVHNDVLQVTISRPEALNALSTQVISELREVFSLLRKSLGTTPAIKAAPDWSIRGVLLTGAGTRAFVAGADISQMHTMSVEQARAYSADAQELTLWIETLAVPVVAAVNGFALGGGCELALACDMIYATAHASFGQPEVSLGLIPGFGGTVRLAQFVGAAHARELIFSGKRISAHEAHRIGLVSQVCADAAEMLAVILTMFAQVSAQSPVAVAASKRTMHAVQGLPTQAGLVIEQDAFATCFSSSDMQEGTAAFLAKRPATFLG